ncbi:hypothetical protein T484DRAFT_1816954, partial [Baffinella frigidus]
MRGFLVAALLLHTLSLSTPGPLVLRVEAGQVRCAASRLGESGAGLGPGSGEWLERLRHSGGVGVLERETLRLRGGGSGSRSPSKARSPSKGGGDRRHGGSASPRGKSSGRGNREATKSSEDVSMGVGGSSEDAPTPQKKSPAKGKADRSPKITGKMGDPSEKDGGAANKAHASPSPWKGKVAEVSRKEGGAGGAVVQDGGAVVKDGSAGGAIVTESTWVGTGVKDSVRTQEEKKIAREVMSRWLGNFPNEKAVMSRWLGNFPNKKAHIASMMTMWGEMFGEDTPEKQFCDAAAADDVPEMKKLAKQDPSLDPSLVNCTMIVPSNNGTTTTTPLIQAAARGSDVALCFLVSSGANLDAQDKDGWTALHYAASFGRAIAAEVLLRAGCLPNVHDYFTSAKRPMNDTGVTPLTLARRWMDRSGLAEHPLQDPRGGDVFYRIEQMLLACGATEWFPSTPGR